MNRRTFIKLFTVVPLPIHKWYDSACCSDQDCQELPDGAVTIREDGYFVSYVNYGGFVVTGLVPFDKARPSRDAKYHGCSIGMSLLCLYAPQIA